VGPTVQVEVKGGFLVNLTKIEIAVGYRHLVAFGYAGRLKRKTDCHAKPDTGFMTG
jgi:hypothetical protein